MKDIFNYNNEVQNPFPADYSGYGFYAGGKLITQYMEESEMYEFHHKSHSYFRDLVLDPKFACIAAQSAARTGSYAFCAYDNLTSPKVAEGIAHDT